MTPPGIPSVPVHFAQAPLNKKTLSANGLHLTTLSLCLLCLIPQLYSFVSLSLFLLLYTVYTHIPDGQIGLLWFREELSYLRKKSKAILSRFNEEALPQR